MRWLINNSTDPYFNMSFDEWCLEHLRTDDIVFYLWQDHPSVIIGVTQDAAQEVNLPYLAQQGISLVRRSTGGGAVYHDFGNLCYSFVGPEELMDTSLVQKVADALAELGVKAEVSGRNDIYVGGMKISGYAKRVSHGRALIHGTLMYEVDIDTLTHALDTPESKLHRKGVASVRSRVTNLRDLLPQFGSIDELRSALHDIFAAGDPQIALPDGALEEMLDVCETKYKDPSWIIR